jgi:hypothetical protein
MIQNSLERMIALRSNNTITVQDANYALEECTFVFRRCLIFLYKQGEIELAHALSVLWKSVILSVDTVLTLNQEKVDAINRAIEKNVKNRVESIQNRLEKENMTLDAQLKKNKQRV